MGSNPATEAHMPEDGRPQAKDGGFFAGMATLIREIAV
jgi:hypothetical protein